MNYSREEFDRLTDAVEEQGGTLLPEICESKDIEYRKKDGYARNKIERDVTQGCGHEAIFVSTYEPEKNSGEKTGFVRACAVCDGVGAWPRYAHILGENDGED